MAQEYTVLRTFHLRLAKLCPRHLHDMFTALPQEAQPLSSAQGPRRSKGAAVARERRERRRMREEGVGEKREEENMNRTYVDNAVSDSLMTSWRIQNGDGSSMRSATGRRRVEAPQMWCKVRPQSFSAVQRLQASWKPSSSPSKSSQGRRTARSTTLRAHYTPSDIFWLATMFVEPDAGAKFLAAEVLHGAGYLVNVAHGNSFFLQQVGGATA